MPKLAILVSGNGSNLQSIIAAQMALDCQITSVIADRPCYALELASVAGIPSYLVERKIQRENLSAEINKYLPADCDLIVLAGFLSILDRQFIQQWGSRLINLHPSLLPKFGGAGMWGIKVHQAVIAANQSESGCTVHYVNNEIDGGEIIHQEKVAITDQDTPETLQQKVQAVEHFALLSAIKQLLATTK